MMRLFLENSANILTGLVGAMKPLLSSRCFFLTM